MFVITCSMSTRTTAATCSIICPGTGSIGIALEPSPILMAHGQTDMHGTISAKTNFAQAAAGTQPGKFPFLRHRRHMMFVVACCTSNHPRCQQGPLQLHAASIKQDLETPCWGSAACSLRDSIFTWQTMSPGMALNSSGPHFDDVCWPN